MLIKRVFSLMCALALCLCALPSLAQETDGASADAGDKFAEQFCQPGESWVISDNEYKSESIHITITTGREYDSNYYIADIYVRSVQNMKRLINLSSKNKKVAANGQKLVDSVGAVLAVNGDYVGNDVSKGYIYANGECLRETKHTATDMCFVMNDGTIEEYFKNTVKYKEVKERGIWHSFLFGPSLLKDGKAITVPTAFTKSGTGTRVGPKNPRTVLGYYEPGHYAIIVVDGRRSKKTESEGMKLTELSAFCEKLGLTSAYNLDGGASSMMWFNGHLVNKPADGGRTLTEILYIAE